MMVFTLIIQLLFLNSEFSYGQTKKLTARLNAEDVEIISSIIVNPFMNRKVLKENLQPSIEIKASTLENPKVWGKVTTKAGKGIEGIIVYATGNNIKAISDTTSSIGAYRIELPSDANHVVLTFEDPQKKYCQLNKDVNLLPRTDPVDVFLKRRFLFCCKCLKWWIIGIVAILVVICYYCLTKKKKSQSDDLPPPFALPE